MVGADSKGLVTNFGDHEETDHGLLAPLAPAGGWRKLWELHTRTLIFESSLTGWNGSSLRPDLEQLFPASQYPVWCTHSIAASITGSHPLKGIILWHHWGSETQTHTRLSAASGWPFSSARGLGMVGICGWSHSSLAHCLIGSTVLLTLVQEGSGSIGAFCPCPSLGVSRSVLLSHF